MRVIGGEFSSRVLKSLPGGEVRPTPDRMREALFNILATRIEGLTFADLYAGTGAVGIEALSRGAAHAVFVESTRQALQVIRENVKSLGLENRSDIRLGRAASLIPLLRADIVFLDPPYPLEKEYSLVLNQCGSTSSRLVIAQHSIRHKLNEEYGALSLTRNLRQGDNVLSFYEREPVKD
jgi:16S rRNA (guanine966-N2)-methyltransferase